MYRLRFAQILAVAVAVATAAVASPARAQEGEKAVEKEKPAEKEGGAPELLFPPVSTRFKVLATGVALTGVAWGITFAASRGWPENNCTIVFHDSYVPGTGVAHSAGGH